MHEIAEYGIAAHALYKDVGSPTEMLSRNRAARWRRTIELRPRAPIRKSFSSIPARVVPRPGVLLTPKGKLIALPRRANVIDFAYAVHTDVGNMAVGCKINGKIAPLVSELTNGDEVEIITSRAQIAAGGVGIARHDSKARAAIRRATRAAVRSQYAGLGRRIVERLCQRAKFVYSDEKLQGAAAAGARLGRRGDVRGRPRRDARGRRRTGDVSRL